MACKPAKASVTRQLFPNTNARTITVDGSFPSVSAGSSGEVFAYVMTSVELRNGRFIQHGCGPNYQGERITLCTCMNNHRTWPRFARAKWVAGLTNVAADNYLFYLMRIGASFDSFAEIWQAWPFPKLAAKSASRDVFGDVYEPKTRISGTAAYVPAYYKCPMDGHKHWPKDWKYDIGHRRSTASGKYPHKLVVGEPGRSYLWSKPALRYKASPHPRFHFYPSLVAFRRVLI